jgi:hypothetical protein
VSDKKSRRVLRWVRDMLFFSPLQMAVVLKNQDSFGDALLADKGPNAFR